MAVDYVFEPSVLEVLLTEAVGGAALHRYRKEFAASLGLSGEERVLDWCGGCGRMAGQIARRLPDGELVIADVSRRWLGVAARRLARCHNVRGVALEGFDSSIAGGQFDVALVHFALHDFPVRHRRAIIRGLAANLKPGGRLVLREPLGRDGSHGIALHELMNLIEAEKCFSYEYEVVKHKWVGEVVSVKAQKC